MAICKRMQIRYIKGYGNFYGYMTHDCKSRSVKLRIHSIAGTCLSSYFSPREVELSRMSEVNQKAQAVVNESLKTDALWDMLEQETMRGH